MKLTTLILSFGLISSVCNAQLSLSGATANPLTGDPSALLEAVVTIHNGSAVLDSVMCERTVNILAASHSSYFCWDICHAPSVDVSTVPLGIAAGADNYFFHGYVNPGGVEGQDTVCYNFYDKYNVSDAASVCFYYDFISGIQILGASVSNPLSDASPNPANNITGINYSVNANDARLVVYNLLGNAVKEIKLNDKQGALILTTSDLGQGIYYYSLFANGKILSTKKLVVAHK